MCINGVSHLSSVDLVPYCVCSFLQVTPTQWHAVLQLRRQLETPPTSQLPMTPMAKERARTRKFYKTSSTTILALGEMLQYRII